MKYILTAFLFVPLFSWSQIEVNKADPPKVVIGAVKKGTSLHSELYYRIRGNDTIYTIMYRNADYQYVTDFKSFSFNSDGGAVIKLYDLLKTFFTDENKKDREYNQNITLGNTSVSLSRLEKGESVLVIPGKGGYFLLTEKQIDKLFGKD